MSQPTEVSILSTTMMKPTKKSDDDSLLQYPNKIMKTPVLRKSKILYESWQCPTSQQLGVPSPINGSIERKQIASFIFGFLNLKNHAMNHPAMMGSQEQTMMNSPVGSCTFVGL